MKLSALATLTPPVCVQSQCDSLSDQKSVAPFVPSRLSAKQVVNGPFPAEEFSGDCYR